MHHQTCKSTRAAPRLLYVGLCLCLQVQYSLLYRRPETNGVFEACKENGVTMVAYSPLCQGLLTGETHHQDGGQHYAGAGIGLLMYMCIHVNAFTSHKYFLVPAVGSEPDRQRGSIWPAAGKAGALEGPQSRLPC